MKNILALFFIAPFIGWFPSYGQNTSGKKNNTISMEMSSVSISDSKDNLKVDKNRKIIYSKSEKISVKNSETGHQNLDSIAIEQNASFKFTDSSNFEKELYRQEQ
ncbi:hypothetical protein J1N09_13330 [Aureitalea sp. L0-47]|uniref:hypothetical protein n=1 Tax=Aureitalea sp. L0-47 TaxID=2816962 RepID=UPI0022386930|nr:hypothetical protein [Aureitalea sp. L0-47]MCW5520824.1 hypothetical protein [Aureitalea sp. L0-47]